MEYNKRQFQKSNDKKVLHKVRKHWVVMSMALLMAIGGKAVAMHVSAHADTTNDNGQTSNTDLIKEHLNQQLTKVQQGQSAQNQSQTTQNNNAQAQQPKLSITSQAKLLHNQILRNASNNVTVDQNTTQGRTNQISNNQPQPKANVTPQSGSINQQKSNVTANAQSASQNNNVQQSSTSQSSAKGSQVNVPKNTKLMSSSQASVSNTQNHEANQVMLKHSKRNLGDFWHPNIHTGTWGNASYTFNSDTGDLSVSDGTISDFNDFKNAHQNSIWGFGGDYLAMYSDKVRSISFNNVIMPSDSSNSDGEFFPNQSGVSDLSVSGLNMSHVKNMNGLFSNMSNLTCGTNQALNLNFGDEPSNLQSMDHTFSNDPKIKTVNLNNLDTSHVTNMSHAFANMNILSNVELGSNFNTSNVTNMDGMFSSDPGLKNLSLGNNFSSQSLNSAKNMLPGGLQTLSGMWGTAPYTLNLNTHTLTVKSGQIKNLNQINQNDPLIQEVPNITSVNFTGDVTVDGSSSDIIPNRSNVTNLSVSGLNLPTASNVSGTFAGLTNLSNLNLASDNYLSSLNQSDLSNMFNGDSSLTSLNLGNLNTGNANNMSSMFQGLSNLTTLNLDSDANFNTNKVFNMSDMFNGDSKLSHLNLGSNFSTGNVNDDNNMMAWVPTASSDVITGVWDSAPYQLKNGTLTVGSDGLGHFGGSIENFTDWVNNGHRDNPLTQAANAGRINKIVFKNGVQVPNNCSNADGSFFPDQGNIKNLDVSGLNMTNVSDMNGMFAGMSSLTNSDYGDNLSLKFSDMPSQVAYTNNLFNGDFNLHSLDLNNLHTYNDQDMSYMFNGMSQLSNLQLGSNFNTESARNMAYMFNGLSDLSNLTLGSEFTTNNVSDMSDMFHGMKALTSLNLGNNFNTNNVTDFNNMFSDMSDLNDLNLGTQFNVSNIAQASGMLNGQPALQTMEGQWNGAPYTLHFNDGKLDVGAGTIDNFQQFASNYNNNPIVQKQGDIKKIDFSSTYAPSDCSAYNNSKGEFFPNQGNITNLDVSGLNMNTALNLRGMFSNMPNLTNSDNNGNLTLDFNGMPDPNDTAKMFEGDSGLRSLHLNNMYTQNDSDMSDMFKNMSNLSDLQLGNSFFTSDVGNNNAGKLSDLFENDSKLSNVNLGSHFAANSNVSTKNMLNGIPSSSTITGVWDTAPYNLSNGVLTVGSDGHGNVGGNIDNFNYWVNNGHQNNPLAQAANNNQIHKIVFKNGVTAPSDCSSYNWNAWPNNSGEFFPDQNSISDLDVSGLNMSNVHNMNGMFENMYNLNNNDYGGNLTLNFQNMPTRVTNTANMFNNDSGLQSLNLNDLNTQSDSDMNDMFNGMGNLNSLTLGSNFNTQNVNNMSNMFNGLSNVTELNLGSHFNTSDVSNMSDMFHGMGKLHHLYLGSDFNTQNVNNMNNMFSDMPSLSDLNLGTKFNARTGIQANNLLNTQSNLQTMEGQWNGAPYTLHFDNGELDVGQGTVDNFTQFANNYANNPLVLKQSNVHKINFQGTTAPSDCSAFNKNDNKGEFLPNQVNVSDLNASDLNVNNVKSMNGMFSGMNKLTNSDYGNTLTLGTQSSTSNVTDMHNLFNGDNALDNLSLGNEFDTQNVNDMSGMFRGMSSLQNLDLSNADFDTTNVSNMSDMFNGLSNVKDLNLGTHFNTQNVNNNGVSNMDNMFNGLSSLQNLNLGTQFNTNQATNAKNILGQNLLPNTATIEGQWNGANYTLNLQTGKLTVSGPGTINNFGQFAKAHPNNPLVLEKKFVKSIQFQNNVKLPSDCSAFDSSDNKNEFFPNQEGIQNLDPSGLDTSDVKNMNGMFSNMHSLTNSDYGNTLNLKFNTNNVSDTSDMFKSDSQLQNLQLGSDTDGNQLFNTANDSRMNNMFNGMSNLNKLDLGLNFNTNQNTSDGSDMISGLGNLHTLKGTWDTAHYTLTSKSAFSSDDGVLNVSDGSIDKFSNRDANYPHDPLVQNEAKINQVLFNNNVKAPSDCSAYIDGNGKYIFGDGSSFDPTAKTVSDKAYNGEGNGEFLPNQHNIKDLQLSGLNMSDVKNMNGMFSGMVNVSNNDLKGNDHDTLIVGDGQFNTPNVTNVANLFNESGGTASMVLPNVKFESGFNTQNVTTMNNMFNGASNSNYPGHQQNSDFSSDGNILPGCQWNVNTINFDSDPNFTTKNVSDLHQMFNQLYFVNGTNPLLSDSKNGTKSLDFSHNDLTISPNAHSLSDMFSDLSDIDTLNLRGIDRNHGFNSSNAIGKGLKDKQGSDITSNVSDMNHMFNNLYGLSDLKLGDNFDTSGVTNMSYMFNNFRDRPYYDGWGTFNHGGLHNLFLGPKFKTDNVSDMSYMFNSDMEDNITNTNPKTQSDLSGAGIYFGNQFHTENVSNMDYMFNNNGLHSLDLTREANDNACSDSDSNKSAPQSDERANRFKINTSSLANMDGMFNALNGAVDIKLGDNFDTHKVTSMNNVFSDCSSLRHLKLDNNFITKGVTAMGRMFAQDSGLSDIDFDKNFDVSQVNNMGGMFQGIGHGTMNLKLNVKSDSDNGINYNNSPHDVTQLCMNPKGVSNVDDVGSMFQSDNVNSIDISNLKTGFNSTGNNLYSTNAMFDNANVNNLNLKNFDTHNVNDMSWMFQGSNISNLNQELPLINTDSLSDMDYMFASLRYPSDLKAYELDTTRNNKPKTTRYMFSGIYNSNGKIEFGDPKHHNGKFDTSDVTAMSGMFQNIHIPNVNVSDINTKSAQYMDRMFSDAGINSVDLPNTNPNSPNYYKKSEFWQPNPQVTTTSDMFHSISIPKLDVSGMNTKSVNNMNYMFSDAHVASPINFGKITNSFEKSPTSSQFNTSNAIDMQGMFQDVYNGETPQTLDLAPFSTGNVQAMDNMFNGANVFYDPNSNPGVNNRGRLNLGNEFDTSQVRSISGMFANLPVKSIGFSPLDDINLGNDFKLANCKAYGSDSWNGGDPDSPNSWGPQDNDGPSSQNRSWVGMFANDSNMNKVDLSHLWPGLDGSGLLSSDNNLSDINLHNFYLKGNGIPYVHHTESTQGDNGRGYYKYFDNQSSDAMAPTQYSDNQPNPYKNYDALRANTASKDLLTIDLNKNDTFRRDNGESPKHKNFFANKFSDASYTSDISHNPAMGQASDSNHNPLYEDSDNNTFTLVHKKSKDKKGKPISIPVYVDANGNPAPKGVHIQPELVMKGDPSQFWYSDATNLTSKQQDLANHGVNFVNWHHYSNYTDGYWYHVDNEGHITQPTNLQDTKSRTGTWFRNLGVNVIIYVDQDGHNTIVSDPDTKDHNNAKTFGDYIYNSHPGLPFGTWIPDPSTDIVISQGRNPNETPATGVHKDYVGVVHIFGEPTSGDVMIPARFYDSDVSINKINSDPNYRLDHTGIVPLYYSGFIGGTYSDASVNNLIDHKDFNSDGGYTAKNVIVRQQNGQWVNAYGNSIGNIIPSSTSQKKVNNFPSALVWERGKQPTAIYVYHHIFKHREHQERIPYQFVLPDGNPVNIGDKQQYITVNGKDSFHYGTRDIPLPSAPDGYSIYRGNETNDYDATTGKTGTYNLYDEQHLSDKTISIDRHNTPQPSSGQTNEILIPIIGDVEEASGPVTYKLIYDGADNNYAGHLPQYMQGIVDIKGQIGQNNKNQNSGESHRVGTVVKFTMNDTQPNTIRGYQPTQSDNYVGEAYLEPHDTFSWIRTGLWDNIPRSDNGYLNSDIVMGERVGRPMFEFHGEGAQITYQYGNKPQHTQYVVFQTNPNNSETISPNQLSVPEGYHIVTPVNQSQITIHANHNNVIMVVPDSVKAIGKWGDAYYTLDNQGTLTLSQSDSYFPPTYSQKTVSDHSIGTSDVKDKNGNVVTNPKTNKPETHNKPVVTYHNITVTNDGEMKTNQWPSKVLYVNSDGNVQSDAQNYANNSGNVPYALNPSDVKHIQFKGHVVLPQDSTKIFHRLPNLTSFDGTNADASNVQNMSHMFKHDPKLTQVDMGPSGAANVQNTSKMFASDGALANVGLSHWNNTGRLANATGMFESDAKLNGSNIQGISDLDIDSLNNTSNMFASDSALTSLNFAGNHTKSDVALNNMSNMFVNDHNLRYLDISKLAPNNLTVDGAFSGDFAGDLQDHTYQIKMNAGKMRFAPQSKLSGHWTITPAGNDPKSPQLDQSGQGVSDQVHTWQKVDPASITVRYMNAAGNVVSTGHLSNTYVGAPNMPLPTTNAQAYANGLDNNYTLNSGQASEYGLSSDNANANNNYNPTVDLAVTGRELNQTLPINVVYENSDGSVSGTPDTTGQPAEVHTNVNLNYPYGGPYNGSFNYQPSDVDHLAGYTLDSDATNQSSFKVNVANNQLNWNQNTPTVYFKANPSSSDNMTINQVVESPNGVVLGSKLVQVPVQTLVNGTVNVGHTYSIAPSAIQAPYDSMLASDSKPNGVNNQPLTAQVLAYHSTGRTYVNQPGNKTLYYVRVDNDAIGQITIHYINQKGTEVGSMTPTGYKGSNLKLSSLPIPIPGYHYDQNNHANANQQMTFGSTKQNVNVYVIGDRETVPVKYAYNGVVKSSDSASGLIGSDVNVPTSNIKSGYMIKPGTSTKETFTYQPDLKMPSDILPLVAEDRIVPVKFNDVNHNNQQVGPMDYSVQGKIDGSANLPSAPKGYNYEYPSDQTYHFDAKNANPNDSNYMNSDNVPVYGDSVQVAVRYVDQNGNSDANGKADYVISPSDNKVMGDTVDLHNVPKGYQIDPSRVNGFNNNSGQLTYTFDPQNIVDHNGKTDVMKEITVHTIGNQEPNVPATVYLQYEDDRGNFVGSAKSDQIEMNDVHVGSDYTLDPKTLVPAGYQLDQSNGRTASSYQAQIDDNGNADWLTQNGKAIIYVKDDTGVAGNVQITKVEETPDGHIVNVAVPDQSVPVSGSVGDHYDINYKNYNNVLHYHLANANEANGSLNHDMDGYVTNHGLTNNHAVLYYVADPASDIDIHYRVSGSNTDLASDEYGNGHAYYGEQMSGLDKIPTGYLLDRQNPQNYTDGHLNQFTFGKQQNGVIYVKADKIANHSYPVKIKIEDPNSDIISNSALDLPSTVNVPINEGTFKIDPNHNSALSSVINAGFNSSDGTMIGQLNGNHISFSDSDNDQSDSDTFTYKADYKNAGTIAVQFINQNGQYVDENGNPVSEKNYPKYYTSASDNGPYRGDSISNVVDAAVGGNYPAGYNYVSGRQDYTFNGSNQIAKIMVKGSNHQDNVTLNLVEQDPNGKYIRTVSANQPINTVVGNTYTFNSNNYQPDGFSDLDYQHPQITKLVANPDGSLSNNGTVTFTYRMSATNKGLKPVIVNFENDRTNQIVAQSDVDPSAINNDYDGMPISDVTKYVTVPKAYTLDNGQSKQAVISQNLSSVTLMVHPTASQGKGSNNSDVAQPILVTFLNSGNLNRPITGASDLPIEGYTGQQVDVLNYYNVPQGYRLDNDPSVNYQIGNKITHAYVYVHPNTASSVPYHLNVKVVAPNATNADHPLNSDEYTKVIPISDSLTVDPNSQTNPIDGSKLPSSSDYKLSDGLSSVKNKTTFVNNNGTLTPNDHDTLVYRAKADPSNLGHLTVQYYDGDRQINVANNVIGQGYYGHKFYDGEQFKPSDLTNLVPVPQGYEMNSDELDNGPQDRSYTMDTANHVIKLYVHGDQAVRGLAHITLNEYDPYNKKLIASPVVSDVINGTVGDSYEIDPQDFVPSGYQLDNPKYANANHAYKGYLNTNGVSDGSKNIQFYYQLPQSNANNVRPINVKYVDDGYPVTERTIGVKPGVDYAGETIANVTAPDEAGLPNGYQVKPSDQNVSATFNHTVQTMIVNVQTTTEKSSGKFFIVYNLYNHDGSKLVQTGAKAVPMSGVIGTSSKISDGQLSTPAGYQSARNPHSVTVFFTPSGLSQSTTSYDYQSDPVGLIKTKYYYNGSRIGNDQKITTDNQGQPLTMNETVDVARGIPSGYQLADGQETLKTAKPNSQTVDLNVEQIPDTSKTFNLTIVRKDPNGNVIKNLPKLTVPVRVTVPVNKSQNISTANFESLVAPDVQQILAQQLTGFKPTSQNGSDVTVTNGNSKLTPSSDVFSYTASQAVQPINVVYYNQHGQVVKSDKISNGYMNEPVSDVTKAVTPPSDYQLIPNLRQQTRYVFDQQPQTANLMVIGNTKTTPVKVNIFKDGVYSGVISDYVHGNVGDDVIVDANNFVPKGYKVAPNHQAEVPVTINGNGVDPDSVQFYYDADPNEQAQPIYVTYVNQSGTPIVSHQQLTGSRVYGKSVNVYDATKRDLDDGNGDQVYTLDDPNADYTYQYGSDAQYVTIQVTGAKTQNTYQVKQIMKNNGNQTSDSINRVVSGRVGDRLTLSPYDYQPDGYTVDTGADGDQQITLVPKGTDSDHAQPYPVSFTYDASSSVDHLVYENDSDDDAIVHEQDLTGNSGDQIKYGQSGVVTYSDNGRKHQVAIPNGYQFEGYGTKSNWIGNHTDVIYVKKTPVAKKYGSIVVNYEDVSGNHPIPLTKSTDYVLGAAGNPVNMAHIEGGLVPNGYVFKYLKSNPIYSFNDSKQTITVGVVPSSSQYSAITVKYMNGSTLISSEKILGQVGSSFDSTPYVEDIPEGHDLKWVDESSAPNFFGQHDQSFIIQVY